MGLGPLRLTRDEDGWWIVSDARTLAWGEGRTRRRALWDYSACGTCHRARGAGTMSEREALIASLAAAYADVLERRGTWHRGICPENEMDWAQSALGAERALHNVALRRGLGWDELRERAQQVSAPAAEERTP